MDGNTIFMLIAVFLGALALDAAICAKKGTLSTNPILIFVFLALIIVISLAIH